MQRTFDLTDQERFAALSGDRNPLHLDPLAARRLMTGGVTVHGIHLLLWSLERLRAHAVPLPALASLRVHFDRAVLIGEPVSLSWQTDGTGRIRARLTNESGTLARLNIQPGDTPAQPWTGPTEVTAIICEDNAIDALPGRTGALELALPPDWTSLFPALAGFPPAQVAALLATTRLVGMVCPGLHSIYSALNLTFAAPSPEPLRYRVIRADARVRLVDMDVTGAGLSGSISTLLRPEPYRQPPLAALLDAVPPDAFAGQRALVIGGSRGLGELAAKLLAAGGAAVTLTYRDGEAEAAAIVAEAAALNHSAEALRFDTAAPPDHAPAAPFTHAYYFATPKIPAGRPGHFRPASFARLLDIYVTGFARTATWFAARSLPNGVIWYPSTVFVAEADPNFPEYSAAKACGEALCDQLSRQLAPLRCIAARLPRLPSDQTRALADLELGDAVAVLTQALRAVA
jgi:NAD(P)-dependent dehydrogenase (short-subunit alcohol dehydrogenase family)